MMRMRATLRFNDRPPVEIDGAWTITLEVNGDTFELYADPKAGEPPLLVQSADVTARLVVHPTSANGIRLGVKHQ